MNSESKIVFKRTARYADMSRVSVLVTKIIVAHVASDGHVYMGNAYISSEENKNKTKKVLLCDDIRHDWEAQQYGLNRFDEIERQQS